jgi:hypothetical protein
MPDLNGFPTEEEKTEMVGFEGELTLYEHTVCCPLEAKVIGFDYDIGFTLIAVKPLSDGSPDYLWCCRGPSDRRFSGTDEAVTKHNARMLNILKYLKEGCIGYTCGEKAFPATQLAYNEYIESQFGATQPSEETCSFI